MKRTIFGLATILVVSLTVLAVLLARPLRTVKAHHGCSERTLMGSYGWTEFGLEPEDATPPHTPPIPPTFWTEAGVVTFDGHGTFAGSNVYDVNNGTPDPLGPTEFTDGSYSVGSDCSVKITYTWESNTYTDHGAIVGADGSKVIATEQGSNSDTTGHVSIKKMGDLD
jgi:hypothetical protein